jgi:isopenicillin N synthase-like dioxygenase
MNISSIGDLRDKGIVILPYPADLRGAVRKAAESWKKFCALPDEIKMTLPHNNGGAGFGYEPKGDRGDNKENFDLTIAAEKVLLEWAEKTNEPVILGFIRDTLAIVPLIAPVALGFAAQAEREFRLEGFAKEIEQSVDRFFIRFIHYFPGSKAGEEIAEAHPDQSGFTLHLFETASGLQCYSYQREWKDMPVSEGETVIIPDMQMQLRSRGEIKALYHRVVATEKTAKDGRYSAVCFVQFKDTPKYDKIGQGPLQEGRSKGKFKLGFNYSMPFGEFASLFKK